MNPFGMRSKMILRTFPTEIKSSFVPGVENTDFQRSLDQKNKTRLLTSTNIVFVLPLSFFFVSSVLFFFFFLLGSVTIKEWNKQPINRHRAPYMLQVEKADERGSR